MAARLTALLVLAALAGCATAPATPQQFCADAANADPQVKALLLHSVSNPYFLTQNQGEIQAARAAAMRGCLKRQGVPPAGDGVQAPE